MARRTTFLFRPCNQRHLLAGRPYIYPRPSTLHHTPIPRSHADPLRKRAGSHPCGRTCQIA
eukprot:1330070-Amorphochlora_amoeboformis.AAC.1